MVNSTFTTNLPVKGFSPHFHSFTTPYMRSLLSIKAHTSMIPIYAGDDGLMIYKHDISVRGCKGVKMR